MSGIDRRSFFKIVATSGAATAAAGCGPTAEKLLSVRLTPREHRARAWPRTSPRCAASARRAAACSRKNRDGRVVKLEGNPDHP